jgi:3-dehydroquinate synthase
MKLDAGSYSIFIQSNSTSLLSEVQWESFSQVIILCDENTSKLCLPELKLTGPFQTIIIQAGEKYKNLQTCQFIWESLIKKGADRHSIMINLGGGVIGDMGGFVASTYMRGINFIQVPTTLLAQVDASIGGKLGIDFHEYKNIIGLFKDPLQVAINTDFLKTLPREELLSGFAEIIKHALIKDATLWDNIQSINPVDQDVWPAIIKQAIQVKQNVVKKDPFEKGLRKILNFGHSVGHAVESEYLSQGNPITHGHGVAIGMVCESHIACQKGMLSAAEFEEITSFIAGWYPKLDLPETDVILNRMLADKKNRSMQKRIATLDAIGHCAHDILVSDSEISAALDYYRQL